MREREGEIKPKTNKWCQINLLTEKSLGLYKHCLINSCAGCYYQCYFCTKSEITALCQLLRKNPHSIPAEIKRESKNFQFPDYSSLPFIALIPFSRFFYNVLTLIFSPGLLVWIGIRFFVRRRRGRKKKQGVVNFFRLF